MADDSHELDRFLRPEDEEKTALQLENLRLRHALTMALADYEMLNRVLSITNTPFHPFTLTPQLITAALTGGEEPHDVNHVDEPPLSPYAREVVEAPPEMDSGGAG